MRINDVLNAKSSHEVITIGPDASVRDLVALLNEHNVGALIVSADGESVDGIVSERDVVRLLADRSDVLDVEISEIMTSPVRTCEGAAAVTELMQIMTEHRIRHVPVMTGGRLTGIISIGDVVKFRLDELQSENGALHDYLYSGR